jgi:hypothetical protein
VTCPKQLVMEPFDSLPESQRARVMFADTPELSEDDAILDAHWAQDHEDEEPEGLSE